MPKPFVIHNFKPNFENDCRICGTTPTVVVPEHPVPETDLCGICFFQDHAMIDSELWNDQIEDTE